MIKINWIAYRDRTIANGNKIEMKLGKFLVCIIINCIEVFEKRSSAKLEFFFWGGEVGN